MNNMAIAPLSSLKGLPIMTRAEQELGTLQSIEIDTERGSIANLMVRPAGLVRGLVANELIIAWSEVIEWTEKRIVVTDACIPAKESIANVVTA